MPAPTFKSVEQARRVVMAIELPRDTDEYAAKLREVNNEIISQSAELERVNEELADQKSKAQDIYNSMELVVEQMRLAGIPEDTARQSEDYLSILRQYEPALEEFNALKKKALSFDQEIRNANELHVALTANAETLQALESTQRQRISRYSELTTTGARFFGDVETSYRSLTGAAGYAGFGGFERGANVAAEILASTEALGRLTVEFPEMTKVAKDWAATIAGKLTPSMIGAGAAMAAMAAIGVIAYKSLQDSAEDAKDAIGKFIAQQTKVTDYYNDTSSAIREEIAEKEKYITALKLSINGLREGSDALEERGGILYDIAQAVDWLPLGVDFGTQDIGNEIKDFEDKINEAEGEITGLSNAIGSHIIAINDAREAYEQFTNSLKEEAEIQAELAMKRVELQRQVFQRQLTESDIQELAAGEFIDVTGELERWQIYIDNVGNVENTLSSSELAGIHDRIIADLQFLVDTRSELVSAYENLDIAP